MNLRSNNDGHKVYLGWRGVGFVSGGGVGLWMLVGWGFGWRGGVGLDDAVLTRFV